MEIKCVFNLLEKKQNQYPDAPFLSYKYKENGQKRWKTFSYRDTQDLVNRTSQLLIDLGLGKDDKIAIISTNRPEWNFLDLGSQQIGLINVPMYPNIAEKDYEFIFKDAGIQYAFVEDTDILSRVQPLMGKVETLKDIYSLEQLDGIKHFMNSLPVEYDQAEIDKRKSLVQREDLATIIYTSGTTGNPKGVMLTHHNFLSNIKSVQQRLIIENPGKSLSFLPLCHSFERTVFFTYMDWGTHISYAENLETIADNLKEVSPNYFSTVPRLLEKVYEKIMETGNALTGFKKKIFMWSVKLASQFKIGESNGGWYGFKLGIARKLVFSKWQEALGGNVDFIVTGAAAMQPRLIRLFTAAGINVLEGYGLTETTPVISVNGTDISERFEGSVGRAIEDVEVKLAEDGEIIVRGDNIMKGYFNRPDLTAEVIDKDGWFHTGDIGAWETRGSKKFLKIIDRKKELFKTSGGKYIAPQVIENKMKESRFIEQIMVVGGDDKKFISALIVPSFMNLKDWAKENNITYTDISSLVSNEKIIALIQGEINRFNPNFGNWEQIKKFKLIDREWTIDGGELTPTLKVKRKNISANFAKEIDQMYDV